MLGPIDFRGLGEHGRAAMLNQKRRRRAEGGVSRHARIGVRAAALQRQGQLAHWNRLSHRLARLRQHVGNQSQATLDGLTGPASILKRHGLKLGSALEPVGLQQEIDLVHLAAETDHENTREVRMLGKAPEHALEVRVSLARPGHAAARRVGQRDHAVDCRMLGHELVGHRVGDVFSRRGRAVYAGQHADIVPGSDPSVTPLITLEGAPLGLGHEGRGRYPLAELIVPIEILHLHVVDMHMLAGRDVLGGEADDLIVFPNLGALGDRTRRDLMTGRDLRGRRDTLVVNAGSRQHVDARGHHVVGGVQAHGQSVSGIVPGLGHGEISISCLAGL